MKILYFDCPTGISGDMCLGAFVDLGLDVNILMEELKKLSLSGYTISFAKEKRCGISGTRIKVKTTGAGPDRTYKEIKKLITGSTLSAEVKELSIKMFDRLARAESRIHGITPLKVHFHEVGAVDSIVDIVGTAIAVAAFKPDEIYSSAVPLGSGWVETSHGRLPVPAPATLELLKGVPTVASPIEAELTTPTGAVILKTLARGFGPPPSMTIKKTGYGVGGFDFHDSPNIFRIIMGQAAKQQKTSKVVQMETNIDDMNPQIAGYLMDRLLEAGALDVFFTPVQMKKCRPGILLTTVSKINDQSKLLDIIFEESTSIGVRYHTVERRCLERKSIRVKTSYGTVGVKVSTKDGRAVNHRPEYEDCRTIAVKKGVPIKMIMDAAMEAVRKKTAKDR